ncbi:serine/threonine protein kinase [Trifolium pratense]|uniref:Serine/threonine protein kinase n=1 Tax=Trifolium pratense TaxID=57577 RepID=A0A2K3NI92_TRIPR|nr:serine/threonine protein kinase [Trifolium pratense]
MSKVIEMLQGPLQSVPYPPKPILYSSEVPSLQISDVSSRNSLEQDMISQTATASASVVNLDD